MEAMTWALSVRSKGPFSTRSIAVATSVSVSRRCRAMLVIEVQMVLLSSATFVSCTHPYVCLQDPLLSVQRMKRGKSSHTSDQKRMGQYGCTWKQSFSKRCAQTAVATAT